MTGHTEVIKVSIANDFNRFPAGRDDVDGPNNGTAFRRNVLVPRLKEAEERGEIVEVSLDGLKSCGSSFLESAFGGLIRIERLSPEFLRNQLRITYTHGSSERFFRAIERHMTVAAAALK